jgi:hypothetical protein
MTEKLQWYLLQSQEIPDGFTPFRLCRARETQELDSTLREDFEFTLYPLGTELGTTAIEVPEHTAFAGVIYGDGTYFADTNGRNYGILGDIQRLNFDEVAVRDIGGDVILQVALSDIDAVFPPVLPPEAFGLRRTPWWNSEYPWCQT